MSRSESEPVLGSVAIARLRGQSTIFICEETTMSDDKVPYGKGSQIATFSIHGTNNEPKEVRDVATQIHNSTVANNPTGKDIYDTRFKWNAPLENNDSHREVAARQLTNHVVGNIVEAVKEKRLDPDKALVVNLVGFSHGGNVAIRAADDIAAALKEHPVTARMNLGIHLTTLSTPAYSTGAETPAAAFDGIRATDHLRPVDGSKPSAPVKFAHTSITVDGDRVIPAANFASPFHSPALTSNIVLPKYNHNLNDVTDNHGALQNIDVYKNAAAREVVQTFNDRTPRQEPNARLSMGVENTSLFASATMQSNDGSRFQPEKQNLQAAINTTPSLTLVDSNATKSIVDTSLISQSNNTINKNDIYKNDGAPLQFDKQNLQAAATTTPSPTLVEGNEAINKLFKQAMSGIENTNVPNKLDAAALAVQTISQAPGFNQDKDISVMQGSKGLIVSQGEGPAGMNLLVPQANKGDLEKVSELMTKSQPDMQLARAPDQDLAKQQSAARTM
jgi:hypothetical protein